MSSAVFSIAQPFTMPEGSIIRIVPTLLRMHAENVPVALGIEGVLGLVYSTTYRSTIPSYANHSWTVGGTSILQVQVYAFAMSIVILFALASPEAIEPEPVAMVENRRKPDFTSPPRLVMNQTVRTAKTAPIPVRVRGWSVWAPTRSNPPKLSQD